MNRQENRKDRKNKAQLRSTKQPCSNKWSK